MRGLWPLLPHAGDETPTSLLSRLALLHGRSPRDFCRDMGQSFQGIVDGCSSALKDFAGLARVAVCGLEANAVRKVADRRFEWRGETFSRDVLARATVRVCPRCLADDVAAATEWPDHAPYGRTLWMLEPLRACALHGIALVTLGKASRPGALHDVASAIAPHLSRLAALAVEAKPVPPSAMEGYLLDRLGGDAVGGGWLDGLSWYAAADACQTIGAVALHGPDVRLLELDETGWRAAGDAGHAIAAGGEPGMRALLTYLDASYADTQASVDGPQARYGALFRRLAGTLADGDFDPLRDVVFRHVMETTAVGADDSLFRRPFGRRVLHSIRSASLEYAVHPKRLRKILVAKEVIDGSASAFTDERAVFTVDDRTIDILEKTANCLSLTNVESYLGAGRVHAKLLAANGFIKPFVALQAETYGELNFAKADLDDFLGKLLAGAMTVVEPPENAFDIPTAAKRANCGAAEIIRLVVERRLRWTGRRSGIEGYRSLLVDLTEIKGLVHGSKREGFTARELEVRLKTSTKVITALITNGKLPTSVITNPVNRCPTRIVRPSDVEAFEGEYVSLNSLSVDSGQHFRAVRKELEARDIRPALTSNVYSATFYRRSDLAS